MKFSILVVALLALGGPVTAQQPPPQDVDAQVKALREALTSAVDTLEAGLQPPKPARLVVRTAAELQAALDTATAGQTIALLPSTDYVETFLLRQTTLTDYVTITTDPLVLPEARVTTGAGMAVLRSVTNMPALMTVGAASYYRFVGVEFGATRGGEGDIIRIGDSQDPNLAHVPHHLQFDRVYLSGGLAGQKRGIAANGSHISITRSTVEDIWRVGQDSQAIASWSGAGPYIIDDNFLEAATQSYMAGGAPPASAAHVPCDIRFTNNDLSKREAWRARKDINVKNLFELKVACRVLVQGNRMTSNWQSAQSGYAIVLTVASNMTGLPGCPPCAITDVRFEGNTVRDVAAGIQILGAAYSSPSGVLDRLAIINNLFVIDRARNGGNGYFISMEAGPRNVVVERNTVIADAVYGFVNAALGVTWQTGPAPIPAPVPKGFIFRRNVVFNGDYGLNTPVGANGRGISWFGDAVVEDNVVLGGPEWGVQYPVSNRRVTLANRATVYDPVTYAILPAFAAAGR
jgi:hypothetical protein